MIFCNRFWAQACLDLIEQRPAGILSILDEQCIMPKATDALLAEKLIFALEEHPRFRREAKDPMVFHVNHYAGPVNYNTSNWLEKNRDVLQADLLQVICAYLIAPSSLGPASAMKLSFHCMEDVATQRWVNVIFRCRRKPLIVHNTTSGSPFKERA